MLHVEMPVKDEATTRYWSVEWYTAAIRNSPQMTPSGWARLKSSSVNKFFFFSSAMPWWQEGKSEGHIKGNASQRRNSKIYLSIALVKMREARVDG